ncbi:MAG: hypothetical protein CBC38_01790 [Gammaproteobacteria bacterium TMED78]|nr:MAG: hypothetical protein CBC38_01790 [Gammaproteobacteria bacterium TMED78]
MARKKPLSISKILHSKSGELPDLMREIKRREEITNKIKDLLPKEDAVHLVNSNITEDGIIILVVDSSEWAARIRYIASEIIRKKIIVKVLPQNI